MFCRWYDARSRGICQYLPHSTICSRDSVDVAQLAMSYHQLVAVPRQHATLGDLRDENLCCVSTRGTQHRAQHCSRDSVPITTNSQFARCLCLAVAWNCMMKFTSIHGCPSPQRSWIINIKCGVVIIITGKYILFYFKNTGVPLPVCLKIGLRWRTTQWSGATGRPPSTRRFLHQLLLYW